jgi:hypothetical protein
MNSSTVVSQNFCKSLPLLWMAKYPNTPEARYYPLIGIGELAPIG